MRWSPRGSSHRAGRCHCLWGGSGSPGRRWGQSSESPLGQHLRLAGGTPGAREGQGFPDFQSPHCSHHHHARPGRLYRGGEHGSSPGIQIQAHTAGPGQLPGFCGGTRNRIKNKPWSISHWQSCPLTLQWHCPLVLLQSGSKPLFTSQLQGPQVGFPHQPFGHCWSILGREIPLIQQQSNSPGLVLPPVQLLSSSKEERGTEKSLVTHPG